MFYNSLHAPLSLVLFGANLNKPSLTAPRRGPERLFAFQPKEFAFLKEQLQKMERSEARERKGLIDASPIFPGWRPEGGVLSGRGERGGMWHRSPGVATVQKEADLQRRRPLTSKASERVFSGPSTTQSITSQSPLVSRTVRGHQSRATTQPPTFLCRNSPMIKGGGRRIKGLLYH